MLVDTHCHINDAEHFPDPVAVIRDARAAGVGRLVIIGVDIESAMRAIEIASANEGVYAAVGYHPNYTAEYESKDVYKLESLLRHPKVVGFGEIGLDFYRETSPSEKQYAALHDQLELAGQFDMPVIFHCRKADVHQLIDLVAEPEELSSNSYSRSLQAVRNKEPGIVGMRPPATLVGDGIPGIHAR